MFHDFQIIEKQVPCFRLSVCLFVCRLSSMSIFMSKTISKTTKRLTTHYETKLITLTQSKRVKKSVFMYLNRQKVLNYCYERNPYATPAQRLSAFQQVCTIVTGYSAERRSKSLEAEVAIGIRERPRSQKYGFKQSPSSGTIIIQPVESRESNHVAPELFYT